MRIKGLAEFLDIRELNFDAQISINSGLKYPASYETKL